MVPRSESATTEIAPGSPEAVRLVPSMGSMATSTSGSRPLPIDSPKYSIGASSFSPSPITTVPRMSTEVSDSRIASTARRSAASLLPLPCSGAAARAPASVTRSSSRARLRLIFGSSITECETLADAAPPDRQFVCLNPQVFLAGETPVAAAVDIDAGALEHRGDANPLLVQHGVKSVDQDLVLVELDLAQAAGTSGAHLGRELQLRTRPLRRAGLDGQARRGRAGQPNSRPRRRHRGLHGER